MLKRLTLLLLEFAAGLAGNLVAGWIQQDVWQDFFTLPRLLGTGAGAGIMLVVIALLESEGQLSWNWRWHRFWYLRSLSRNPQLKRWETEFARLQFAHGRRPLPTAEVLADGKRQDVVAVLLKVVLQGQEGQRRALVLGEPGSGKTTALERLTWESAHQGARRLGWGRPVPILLRLGNYQEGKLLSFAVDEMLHTAGGRSAKVMSRSLPVLLEKGHIILVCDALDEALGKRRDRILAELDRLLRSRLYESVPIIISARTREDPGNRLGKLFAYTLQDLSDEAILTFIRVYRRETDEETDVLARLQRAGLLEAGGLGRNPFWLRLVVQSSVFQARKGELLIQSVETLLAREWDEKPLSTSWVRALPREEQLYETRLALMWLAHRMSTEGVVSVPYEQVVHDWLPQWCEKRKGLAELQPTDIIGLGREAQLLIYWPGPLTFRHRLIQEALTAQLLAKHEALQQEAITQYAATESWWETLIMLGHLVDDPGMLAGRVLGDGQSEQQLFLAVGILQSSGGTEPAMRQELLAALAHSLDQGITPGHKAAAIALAQIIHEDVVNLLITLLKTAGAGVQRAIVELLDALQALDNLLQALLPRKTHIEVGDWLAGIGDPRPGVGVNPQTGLPDIVWGGEVPAGDYTIGDEQPAYSNEALRPAPITTPYHLALTLSPMLNSSALLMRMMSMMNVGGRGCRLVASIKSGLTNRAGLRPTGRAKTSPGTRPSPSAAG